MVADGSLYGSLCRSVKDKVVPPYIVRFFEEEISSCRRMAAIKTYGDLIRVLQKRDILTRENMEPLRKMYDLAKIMRIWERIHTDHQEKLEHARRQLNANNNRAYPRENGPRHFQNQDYVRPPLWEDSENVPRHFQNRDYVGPPLWENSVLPPLPSNPIERVHKLIVRSIGSKWKDLARELDVPEGLIDKLEDTYRYDMDRRVMEVLDYHYKKASRHTWRNELQHALREARRLDISIQVGDILSNHNIS